MHGLSRVPLVYMIQKDIDPNAPYQPYPMQIRTTQAPLQGPSYQAGHQKVYQIICDTVSGSDGWAWIHDVKNEDGCLAMLKLREHYDWARSKTCHVQDAKEHFKSCHYKSKMTFSFEKYVTALKECFDTLKEDKHPITKHDKIDYLLNGIQCQQMSSAISTISMNPRLHETFEMAANILSWEVQQISPMQTEETRDQWHNSQPPMMIMGMSIILSNQLGITKDPEGEAVKGQGGGGRVGWGARGQDARMIINGINITDLNKSFTLQEWAHLRGFHDVILQQRHRTANPTANQGQHYRRGGGRGWGSNEDAAACSVQALQQANQIVSEITANMNQESDGNANAGNNFGPASYGGRHVQFENQGGRGPRNLSKVITRPRRIISSARTCMAPQPEIIQSNCEMDSHADTCCLGANFMPLYFTGKVCNVSTFLNSIPVQENIEVCTSATAY